MNNQLDGTRDTKIVVEKYLVIITKVCLILGLLFELLQTYQGTFKINENYGFNVLMAVLSLVYLVGTILLLFSSEGSKGFVLIVLTSTGGLGALSPSNLSTFKMLDTMICIFIIVLVLQSPLHFFRKEAK